MPLNNQIIVPKYIDASGRFQETILTPQEIGAYSGNNPSGFITGIDLSSYATAANLNNTGSTLNIKIDSVSGYLQNQIDSLSGAVTSVNGRTGVVVLDSSDINYNKLYFSITGSNSLINGEFQLVQIHESSRFIYNLLGYNYNGDDRRIATWSTPNNRWELRAYQPNNNFTLLYFNTGASIYPPQTSWTANAGVTEPAPIIVYDSLTAEDTFSLLTTEDFRLEERINNTSSLIPQGGAAPAQVSTDLVTTGSTLNSKIDNLSGYSNDTFATITNLSTTGLTLDTRINNLSGVLTGSYYLRNNPSGFITGVDTSNLYPRSNPSGFITGVDLSNYVTKTNGEFINRPTVNGTGVLLSGEATQVDLSSTVRTTGDQKISGEKIFKNRIGIGESLYDFGFSNFQSSATLQLEDYGNSELRLGGDASDQKNTISFYNDSVINFQIVNDAANDSRNLHISGNGDRKVNFNNRPTVNGTGVLLSGEAAGLPTTIVYTTGNQTISGAKNFVTRPQVNNIGVVISGEAYPSNNPSGFITGIDTSSFYPRSNPSGFITGVDLSPYATVTNLNLTGSNLQNQINNLNNTYATDAELSGVNNTLNTKINSLSGAAVLLYGNQTIDGTKTFRNSVYIHDLYVTGTEFIANVENNFIESPYILLNLTGGAVDGGIFFVTGTGLTGINDYGPIIGFDHTDQFKFGIARRSDDLSILDTIAGISDITNYSGFVDDKYATIINLNNTGTNLQTNINTVATNLVTTGSILNIRINSLSGTLTGDYYPRNNPSGFITGVDTSSLYPRSNPSGFITGIDLSAYVTKSSGAFTNRPTVNGTGVLLSGEGGSVDLSSYVTTGQLTQTSGTLQSQIDVLSVNSIAYAIALG